MPQGGNRQTKSIRMKKFYLVFALAACLASGASADYKAGYYNKLNGKSGKELKQAAKECVQSHQTLDYYSLPNYWQYSDVYPELVNGSKRWWDMYSDAVYLIKPGQSGTKSFSSNKMQREHSVPKSWWKSNGSVEYTPAYSDMWNLYPSDGAANQAKLNYPLGLTASTSFNNGVSKVGGAQTGYGGGSGMVFEPDDEYKGDFARAFMYMAVVYDDLPWVINYMYKKENYPTLQNWAINMLLDWGRRDVVSQKEIDRNNVVEQYQGNRNPFIDFPELAEYIWGSRVGEVFYIDDQETVDPTPPVEGDPELTQPVNGEGLDFGQVAEGRAETRVLQIVGKNFTSALSVRVTGADKDCFIPEITKEIPAATINQNQGYLLNITYKPTSIGKHQAKIALYDGGLPPDKVTAVTLTGECLAVPTFSTLTALEPTDVTSAGYTARWNAVPSGEIADFYLLTRVRLKGDDREVDTYETGETSYALEGREPGVPEIYYVQYSRLGLLSPVSNEIYVAGSSVEELPQAAPVDIFSVTGGFMVRTHGSAPAIRVFDVNGAEVLFIEQAQDGEIYLLPAGVFVVYAEGMRPVKIIN